MKNKKELGILISYLSFCFLFAILFIIRLVYYLNIIDITNIEVTNYDKDNNKITIKITKNDNRFTNDFNCNATYNDKVIKSKGTNNECNLTISLDDNYHIYLNSNGRNSKEYSITDFTDSILSFSFKEKETYLLVGEEKKIEYNDKILDKKEINYNFKSSDDSIVSIINNKMVAKKVGSATISSEYVEDQINVVVTDLISAPTFPESKKTIIPCDEYSEKDANILDKLLAYRINNAEYQTRGAAIAAARFLTLEFKYRLPYFYENGRIHKSGVHWVDGEGRYYHEGLYLSNSKVDKITSTWRGPAKWGCPLTNLENEPGYGFISGSKKPNGLDCSGFVTWVLKNAGFDPGDIGAGETDYPYQCTDLGDYQKLTNAIVYSGKIKTGDLINFWGHIAIIIGIDENNIYVAESLPYLGGVVPMKYNKSTITNTFDRIIFMDKYYKKDGIYEDMW